MKTPIIEITSHRQNRNDRTIVEGIIYDMTPQVLLSSLLSEQSSDGESSWYLCDVMAHMIVVEARHTIESLKNLDYESYWFDNCSYVSSASVNYALLDGLKAPPSVMASARAVIRKFYSYHFEGGLPKVKIDSMGFSISSLLEDLEKDSSKKAKHFVESLGFNSIGSELRTDILERIIAINPEYVFPPLPFKVLV